MIFRVAIKNALGEARVYVAEGDTADAVLPRARVLFDAAIRSDRAKAAAAPEPGPAVPIPPVVSIAVDVIPVSAMYRASSNVIPFPGPREAA